jgi:YhcH/YjgK/YiaL family protein
MKKPGAMIILLVSILIIQSCSYSSDPAGWSDDKLSNWFESGEFIKGLAITPDASINKREFAVAYFKNKERWDKAFAFLKINDLKTLEVKRHDIDGDNLYAMVSEYISRNEEDVKFEAHRKYADIQCVISGIEQISVADVSKKAEVLTPYDETRDLEFMTVSESFHYIATPDKFFLFFPCDLHRPGVKAGDNSQVKKVVVKVKL